MRTTYDLTIPSEEKKKFKHALKTLGLKYDFCMVLDGTDIKPTRRYTIKLSKYEFLYVRLAVTIVDARNVDEWNAKNS